ncbi:MAG: hypothetical protein ABI724_01405 [Betaproteobacteria bacterium]
MIAADASGRATIAIGRVKVGLRTSNKAFLDLLHHRYTGYIADREAPDYEFDIVLTPPTDTDADDDVRVFREGSDWHLERGDFHAHWNPGARQGRIHQSANPYSIDAVLRIVHTLVLANEGGFLMHSASAVRNGKAFLFAGVSGAGKTTISRLAPDDADVLTDEISYVRKEDDGYHAYGTPFAGELARAGENLKAPIDAVYLLAQGPDNRIDDVDAADAARALLTNILFFAEDPELVQAVFHSALEFVDRVPVRRLTFVPDARVWELIQ